METIDEQISLATGVISQLHERGIDDSKIQTYRSTLVATKRDGNRAVQPMPPEICELILAERKRRVEKEHRRKRDSGEFEMRENHIRELDESIKTKQDKIKEVERGDHRTGRPERSALLAELKELKSQREGLMSQYRDEREAFEEPELPSLPTEAEAKRLEHLIAVRDRAKRRLDSCVSHVDTQAFACWSSARRAVENFKAEIGRTGEDPVEQTN